MIKYVLSTYVLLCLLIAQPVHAMNSEFQKPEDELDSDVYATPAEEDLGETLDTQSVPEQPAAENDASTETPTEQPAIHTPAVSEVAEEPTEQAPAASTSETQQQRTAPQTPPSTDEEDVIAETQQAPPSITPITSPSDGTSSDVRIEKTNNVWLFAIAGGAILLALVALLLQRLRKA